MRIVSVMVLGLLVGACATGYQRNGLTGGFDEVQLDTNVYQVNFKGNGYTTAERAADLCLLRSAELTLERGYKYFAIVDRQERVAQSSFKTPTQSYTTSDVSGTVYRGTFQGSGTSTTTTYGGQTIHIARPSAQNTVLMVNDRAEVQGMTYDAAIVYRSLAAKYDAHKQ